MSAVVCPTILARDAHEFQTQMGRVAELAPRLQIDLTDGVLAPTSTVKLDQVWYPDGKLIDLHLMFSKPEDHIDEVLKLNPHLVIVHAEAEGNFVRIAGRLHKAGIKAGVALLPKTSTHVIKPAINIIDHVLIFSGDLGKFGGVADPKLLFKVRQLKEWKSSLEIGWDGGVKDTNVVKLAEGGVDVLNVGGFLQQAVDPKANYDRLVDLVA